MNPREPTDPKIRQALVEGVPEVSQYPSTQGKRSLRGAFAGTGDDHQIFARDGEQDLICVDPNSSGTIEAADRQDDFIFNQSC